MCTDTAIYCWYIKGFRLKNLPQICKVTTIPIKIRGELENPKIYPDIKTLTQKEQSQAINSLLQTGLKDLLKRFPPQWIGCIAQTGNILAFFDKAQY